MKRSFNPWLLVMLIILAIFIFNQFNTSSPSKEITYATFLELVEEGKVDKVTIQEGESILGEMPDPWQVTLANGENANIQKFKATYGTDDTLSEVLRANNVDFRFKNPSPWFGILFSMLPIIICLLYTSPSPRDATLSRMPSSA